MNKNIFVINKPKDLTSNQVIQIIKKNTNIKKIGHGGTLDPLATGVLIIGVNHGTKLLSNNLNDNKSYIATIKFGISTDTYDSDGKIIDTSEIIPSIDNIKEFCNYLVNNEYNQTVPLYSAVKVNGQELYKYARNNQPVDVPSKLVKLYDCKIIDYNNSILKISMDVSKGFYIRSFVNDLAKHLNTCCCLIGLIRTKSGTYSLDEAYDIDSFIEWWNNK